MNNIGESINYLRNNGFNVSSLTYPNGHGFDHPVSYLMKDNKKISKIVWKREGALLRCFPKSWNSLIKEGNKIRKNDICICTIH